jgi:hypothetical protein
MKKFFYIVALAVLAVSFVACEHKDPYDTQSPDDEPRILRPYFNTETGHLSYYLENDTTPLIDSVTVTPSRYTTVNWYVDDVLVFTGLKINMCFSAGTHNLLIEAVTTMGKRTERTGTITVGESMQDDAIVLFEGSADLNWDEHNIEFTKEQMQDVAVDAKIYVEFEIWPSGDPRYNGGDEYQLLRVITDWDHLILSDVQMGEQHSPYVFIFEQEDKEILESIGKMSFVGWGLNITKIAYK